MADSANAIKKSEPGCGCAYSNELGEHVLCPEGGRLLSIREKAYRRRVLFDGLGFTAKEHDRADKAYRAHVEAVTPAGTARDGDPPRC